MSGVNKIILLGRVGKKPELSTTPSGMEVCKFSIATSEKYKDKETTVWHDIVVWSKLAVLCNQYLYKGREVYIEGKLEKRTWEDKNYPEIKHQRTEVNASVVQFIGKNEQQPTDFVNDDIPF